MYSEHALLNTFIHATLKNRMKWTTDTTNIEAALSEMRSDDIVLTFFYDKMQATFALLFNEETELVRFMLFDAHGDWLYEIDSDDEQDGELVRTLFDVVGRQMSGVASIIDSVIHDFS
ncbi:MAG: hypothetical protein UHX00_04995 [Caryophanon sp.]|nr:hypothetical protein [Caryophanon sp.]